MSTPVNDEIIQYVPFKSFVHPSFWHTLTDVKLEVDKLNENKKQIFGRFAYRFDVGSVFEVDGTSFNKSPQTEKFYEPVTGTIVNKNIMEDFKNIDKASLLNSVGEDIWTHIKDKSWINKPNSLLSFFILSFADLKKFHYYYWFAYPSPSQPTVLMKNKAEIISHFDKTQIERIMQGHKSLEADQKCYFFITKEKESMVQPLSSLFNRKHSNEDLNCDLSKTYFGFLDPSNGQNPGWPLRVFLAALFEHCPNVTESYIQVVGLRYINGGGIENSRVFTLKFPKDAQSAESSGWLGWERNDRGYFGPKMANMSKSMDPKILAESSSDLNIKLMKWRLVPDLDFNVMKQTKCLLLGAGTLGCHVARDLLAWGFRHITFVDSGKVSYSNPTRQFLYTHEDCAGGGRLKVDAAADNLRRILPTVVTKGLHLQIPMPGHTVGSLLRAETMDSVQKLTAAVQEHDVIFLLLDTREARWLPTLLAAHFNKIVINAALGFDSYLVMRHGIHGDPPPESIASVPSNTPQPSNASQPSNTSQTSNASQTSSSAASSAVGRDAAFVRGKDLGCYFCNDVTAPGNSLKDRTLDRQCTVTRPGAAAIAGALAVELLVGLLQHPDRVDAPALCDLASSLESTEPAIVAGAGVLGPVPHSVRGFLHSAPTVTPTCVKFAQCVACSHQVVHNYRKDGALFVIEVCNSGTYLEQLTGLSELHRAAELTDIMSFSDDEDED